MFTSLPRLPGPRGGEDLDNRPRGGPVQPSAEKEQSSAPADGQTSIWSTWGHRASLGEVAGEVKLPALGGALASHSRPAGSGEALCSAAKVGRPPCHAGCPLSFTSPSSPVWSLLKLPPEPSQESKRGGASETAQIPTAPRALALPGSGQGVQQMSLIRGLHVAPRPAPGRVSLGSCAPDAARRALACGESPAGPSGPRGAPLSRPLGRAGAALGSRRFCSRSRSAPSALFGPRQPV